MSASSWSFTFVTVVRAAALTVRCSWVCTRPTGRWDRPGVTCVVRRVLARAGITGPGSAHRLRHTAACRVLAGGGGLVEAGQLLRHATAAATAIYAKSDLSALAILARPWPGAQR